MGPGGKTRNGAPAPVARIRQKRRDMAIFFISLRMTALFRAWTCLRIADLRNKSPESP
jgi:hypothetical protein